MPRALAIFAHPDDIEFVAAGTMLRLAEKGWELHYHTTANGECGSMETSPTETARIRNSEARNAATILGAEFHPPIGRDMCIFYDDDHLRRLAAVVRKVNPEIVLTHALSDYMEDHMNTARLAVTATFAQGMPNFATIPPSEAVTPGDRAVYHAMPHGLAGPLREEVPPDFYIDTTEVHGQKRAALAAHASQKAWLDTTQGMDSYLVSCDETSLEVGRRSGSFEHAEGWRCHNHLGFSSKEIDPLSDALGEWVKRA